LSNRWTETIGLGSAGSVSPRTLPSAALLVEVSPTVPPLPNTTEVDALLVDDAWRCDDLVSGTGCVDPEYTPTITFNTGLNPLVRPVALHMRDAQAELPQHWGVPGGDHPLLRLTDPTQASANTRAACASFVPDPPVATSCDEYPFASSYEGGAGASIRAVPLSANNSQGGILNGGYNTWRILDADAFYVQVIIDDTNTEKVMVVGDSISQGLDGDFTWRYRLWQHFQSDGVIDAFVGPRTGTHDLYSGTPDGGGYRVAGWEDAHDALWGRAALDEQNTIEGITSQYRPDVILVEMGINDLVWFSTPDELIDTMRNLVGNARLANPDAKFVIGNVMDRTPLSDWPDLPGKIDSYDALLPGLVSSLSTTQSPVVMADLHAALDPATDTHDGLHPNEIGEYKIAATFADTLATAYGIGQDFGPIPTSVPELTMTTPTLTVTANDGGALLSWTHSYGADGYWIWAENVSGGETTLSRLPLPIGDDHWQAGALADGQTVKYAVQSRRSDTNVSDLSNAVQVTVHPKTPQYTAATYSTSCTGCNTISTWWDPITGADSYQVLWVDETLDPNTLLSAPSSTTSYTISAIPGHEYVIAVSGVNQYGDGVASGVPEIYAGLGAPDTNQLTVCQYTGGWTAHLEWTAVPGATGYMIWTRNWVNGDPFTPLAYPVQSLSFDPGLMVDGSLNHEFAIQPVNGSMAAPLSNAMRVS
ncbi:MAG TPA: NucA/NucB deoxyribonuclease domain-containing protein, partial [Jatrophihabitans sp.]|nr:NucA/NucB deoxyribonuclease domain-containing protein [Jatrophihabitans sp.]